MCAKCFKHFKCHKHSLINSVMLGSYSLRICAVHILMPQMKAEAQEKLGNSPKLAQLFIGKTGILP